MVRWRINEKEVKMAEPTFISRRAAEEKITKHWRKVIRLADTVGLPYYLPNWERLRNYEYEGRLKRVFGGEWIINEMCPFDGRYCAWGDHLKKKGDEDDEVHFSQGR